MSPIEIMLCVIGVIIVIPEVYRKIILSRYEKIARFLLKKEGKENNVMMRVIAVKTRSFGLPREIFLVCNKFDFKKSLKIYTKKGEVIEEVERAREILEHQLQYSKARLVITYMMSWEGEVYYDSFLVHSTPENKGYIGWIEFKQKPPAY